MNGWLNIRSDFNLLNTLIEMKEHTHHNYFRIYNKNVTMPLKYGMFEHLWEYFLQGRAGKSFKDSVKDQ